jgi:glycerophosphoryl diester phosphodiesterase
MTTKEFVNFIKRYKTNNSVPLFAHRGLSSLAPDNSLQALELAFSHPQVAGVECDVQQTKDRELIIRHNRSVKIGNARPWLESLSLTDYRRENPAQLSPLLIDVIKLAQQSNKILDLELKSSGIASKVIYMCKKHNLYDRVILTTIYEEIYAEIKAADSNIAIMYGYPRDKGKDLAQQAWTQPFVSAIVQIMKWQAPQTIQRICNQIDTPFISLYHKILTRDVVKLLHQNNKLCIGCTIRLPNEGAFEAQHIMEEMVHMDVDLIKTDFPQVKF